MLKVIRIIVVAICCILICVIGSLYSLINFKNPNNVAVFAHWFARLHPLFGLKVEYRYPQGADKFERCIYVGNHQNNYDMVTISHMVMPRTVSVGKKSLIWIPFFGVLYWITGNIFIDRENRSKAHSTMTTLAKRIHKDNLSIWMFPEGTRSRGRGLLPLKPAHFMPLLKPAFRLFRLFVHQHIIKLILIAGITALSFAKCCRQSTAKRTIEKACAILPKIATI